MSSQNNKKRLYLAAPLFSDAEKAYNVYVKRILQEYFDVYLPQEDGCLIVELVKKGVSISEATRIVFGNDMKAIAESDVLLIILDGRTVDEGAAFELGVAFSRGIECVALQTDPRRLLMLGNNPMISSAVSEIFQSIESLEEWAERRTQLCHYKKENYESNTDFMRVKERAATYKG